MIAVCCDNYIICLRATISQITMAEKLAAISAAQEKQGKNEAKSDSQAVLLAQGLKSNDQEVLNVSAISHLFPFYLHSLSPLCLILPVYLSLNFRSFLWFLLRIVCFLLSMLLVEFCRNLTS